MPSAARPSSLGAQKLVPTSEAQTEEDLVVLNPRPRWTGSSAVGQFTAQHPALDLRKGYGAPVSLGPTGCRSVGTQRGEGALPPNGAPGREIHT